MRDGEARQGRWFATVDDREHELGLEDGAVVAGGERLRVGLESLGTEGWVLRLDGRAVPLFARRVPDGWRVELEGRVFTVRVEDERARRIRELSEAAAPAGGALAVRAPMPGLIVRVEVEPGDRVEAGAGLVVMEAMKMENELRAEAAGVVTEVAVGPGQAVDHNDVLVRLERE